MSGVPQALIGSHRQSLPTFGKAGDGVLSAHSAEGSRILDALRHLPPAVHMGRPLFPALPGCANPEPRGWAQVLISLSAGHSQRVCSPTGVPVNCRSPLVVCVC